MVKQDGNYLLCKTCSLRNSWKHDKILKSATCIFTNCLDVGKLDGHLNLQICIFLQALSIFLLLHPLHPLSSQSKMVSCIGWHQNSPQSASSNTIWAEAATGLSISGVCADNEIMKTVAPSPTTGNEIFTLSFLIFFKGKQQLWIAGTQVVQTWGSRSLCYQQNHSYQNIWSTWPLLEIFPRQEFARAAK